MQKVENATGRLVVWNRKSLLQLEDEDEAEVDVEEETPDLLGSTYHGRRRRSTTSEDLPPRARRLEAGGGGMASVMSTGGREGLV